MVRLPTGSPGESLRVPSESITRRTDRRVRLVQVKSDLFPSGALSVHRALLFFVLAATLAGCDRKIPESGNVSLSEKQPAAEGELIGTVLEVLPAPPYVYLRLKAPRGEVWAAVEASPVAVGSQVTVANAILMKGFASSTLNRTFDEVYFGSLAPAVGGAIASGTPNPHDGAAPPIDRITVGNVEKASGPGARTVAETWAQKASLDGNSVTIRGVVVKVNEGVMGKNWIHLQDGSGDVAQGTFDITVTSQDKASAGETITVTGTVRTNRDVGAGYRYAVLVEDAKVVKR